MRNWAYEEIVRWIMKGKFWNCITKKLFRCYLSTVRYQRTYQSLFINEEKSIQTNVILELKNIHKASLKCFHFMDNLMLFLNSESILYILGDITSKKKKKFT